MRNNPELPTRSFWGSGGAEQFFRRFQTFNGKLFKIHNQKIKKYILQRQ